MIEKDEFCEQILLLEKPMYFLAFSVVKNEADSADIISEAICRAYKNINTLKDINSFKPWILRIVHNTAVEFVRKNSRLMPLEDLQAGQDSAEKRLTTEISLKAAVDSLPPKYRTVVMLYYYENLSVSEISSIIGLTQPAVKQRLLRARKQLREILKEDFVNE